MWNSINISSAVEQSCDPLNISMFSSFNQLVTLMSAHVWIFTPVDFQWNSYSQDEHPRVGHSCARWKWGSYFHLTGYRGECQWIIRGSSWDPFHVGFISCNLGFQSTRLRSLLLPLSVRTKFYGNFYLMELTSILPVRWVHDKMFWCLKATSWHTMWRMEGRQFSVHVRMRAIQKTRQW